MATNKDKKKKNFKLKNIKSLLPKNLSLKKIDINPTNVFADTTNKINKFYENFKKEREKKKNKT